jgi:hypothetical protein
MAEAGVSTFAPDRQALTAALHDLTADGPYRSAQTATAADMFRSRAADAVMSAQVSRRPARAPVAVAVRVAAAMTALASFGWLGLTSGVAVATEAGAGVAHPGPDHQGIAYVGVRLDGSELADPVIVADLRRMDLTAVVDDATATGNLDAVRLVVRDGINVESGGLGDVGVAGRDHDSLPWTRAQGDAKAGRRLGLLIDRPVRVTIPGRRVTAWDLVDAGDAHMTIVVPDHIVEAARVPPAALLRLSQGGIYMINGLDAAPSQLETVLGQLGNSLETDHLSAAPLATLT